MANTNYPANTQEQNRPVKTSSGGAAKGIIIGVLAVVLLGSWAYILYDKNKTTQQIEVKTVEAAHAASAKDSIQTEYNAALTRLDSLTGSNNNLQGQLTDRQADIVKLKNQINKIINNKNATAADLKKAKGLIGDLNGKISNLEAEVARLQGENQQLATANTTLTQEKETLTTSLQQTTQEKEDLSKTVDVGSTFTASNINIKAINEKGGGKEKETTTAKRVDKLVVSFDVENRIAKSGPADVYVIVTAPDGQVISDPTTGSQTLNTRNDGDKPYTYKTTIEYEQGTRKTVQVPLRQQHFQTGDYKVEVYQNGFKIAEGVRPLKKGGLFS